MQGPKVGLMSLWTMPKCTVVFLKTIRAPLLLPMNLKCGHAPNTCAQSFGTSSPSSDKGLSPWNGYHPLIKLPTYSLNLWALNCFDVSHHLFVNGHRMTETHYHFKSTPRGSVAIYVFGTVEVIAGYPERCVIYIRYFTYDTQQIPHEQWAQAQYDKPPSTLHFHCTFIVYTTSVARFHI